MELQDDYEHISNEIFYTIENIIEEDEQLHLGCNCEKECRLENNCSCLEHSGAVYTYEKDNQTLYDSYCIEETDTNKPIYECNKSCKCFGRFCGNRLVQFGSRKNLKIINAGEKGFGLTTSSRIKKGNFICEYAGEVISENEAKRRYETNKTLGKMNYIFCINEHFGEKSYKTFIDPSVFGNIGRYVNHSCEPNCVLYPIRVNFITPKLGIFAKTDIEESVEITFDYGIQDSITSDDLTSRISCLCNAQNCRKYLPYCPQIE